MMNSIIPWKAWIDSITPVYFNNKTGRPARGIETMLRMYLLQAWFNLSDEAVEDTIYDSYAFRTFMKIDFTQEQAPDATTLCKFRKLITDNGIAEKLFDSIKCLLEEHGQLLRGGTIVDATIIEAPSSTKNRDKKRDPEMHSAKKGNQWHFGMKAHIGVDAGTGYIHTVTATSANVSDVAEGLKLLREDDTVVYGDSGYLGLSLRDEIFLESSTLFAIDYRINARPGVYRKLPEGYARDFEKQLERRKSTVRAKVEYPFLLLKRQFGYRKTVYRGIVKNLQRLFMLFCSSNLLMCARSGGWRTA
jgi:IS5 family transposase